MTLVESCTVTGDLYEYENFDERVLLSPWGAFGFDEEDEFQGKIVAFQASQMGERELVEEDYSFSSYMVSEELFVPVEEVSEYRLGASYVMNGERLVTLGDAKFLRPELLGGEQTSKQVIEVYTHAFRTPHSVEDRMEEEWVDAETVAERFEEAEVERIEAVGN